VSGELRAFAQAILNEDRSAMSVLADWYQDRVGESGVLDLLRLVANGEEPDTWQFAGALDLALGGDTQVQFEALPELLVMVWWTGNDRHRVNVAIGQRSGEETVSWFRIAILPLTDALPILRRIDLKEKEEPERVDFLQRLETASEGRPPFSPDEVGERLGRRQAKQTIASQLNYLRWDGPPSESLTAFGFAPGSSEWAIAIREARACYERMLTEAGLM
jgi:hypothetical protein